MEEDDVNPTVKMPRIKPALQSTPPDSPAQEQESGHTAPIQAVASPASNDDAPAAASTPPVVEMPPWLRPASQAAPPERDARPVTPEPPVVASMPPSAPPPHVAAPSWLQYIGAAESPVASQPATSSNWAEVTPTLPVNAMPDAAPTWASPPTVSYPPAAVPAMPVAAPKPIPSTFDAAMTAPSMPAFAASIPATQSATPDYAAEDDEDMANVQWEYCRIQLDSGSYGQKQTIGRYPYFVRVTIDYYGADFVGTEVFGEDTDQIERPNKMWGQILGLLGLANWELVNIFTGSAKDLALVNVMAYLKRPVQAGRRVNEPKIVMS